LKVSRQGRLIDSEIIVENVEKLLLHEVDLGKREEASVALPVHVLRGRVVEVLCGANEDGEEDTMPSALHAVGDWRETLLETVEVDKNDGQRRHLHVGLDN